MNTRLLSSEPTPASTSPIGAASLLRSADLAVLEAAVGSIPTFFSAAVTCATSCWDLPAFCARTAPS